MILASLLLLCAQGPDARSTEWREALELDLPATVLQEGPRMVTAGGELHTDGEAVALVARALFVTGKETLAKSLLRDARPSEDTQVYIALERARIALDEDDLAGALRGLVNEGKLRYPLHPECWLLVGRAFSRAGARDKADPVLARFTELAPLHVETPSAWHMLAQHSLQAGDAGRAAQLQERGQAAARWQAYYRARRIQKREKPAAPLPRLGLAQLWMEAQELERARLELEALIQLAPEFVRGWSHLGRVHAALGSYDAALTAFDKALALDAKDFFARCGQADLVRAMGDTTRAHAEYTWIAENGPEDDARTLRAHLELARLAEDDATRGAHYQRYLALGGTEEL